MPAWYGPEIAMALHGVVIVLLVVAIWLGLVVLARIRSFKQAASEWADSVNKFSDRAEATESSLTQLNATLTTEATRRQVAETKPKTVADAAAQPNDDWLMRPPSPPPSDAVRPATPKRTEKSPPATAVQSDRTAKTRASSILSMQ